MKLQRVLKFILFSAFIAIPFLQVYSQAIPRIYRVKADGNDISSYLDWSSYDLEVKGDKVKIKVYGENIGNLEAPKEYGHITIGFINFNKESDKNRVSPTSGSYGDIEEGKYYNEFCGHVVVEGYTNDQWVPGENEAFEVEVDVSGKDKLYLMLRSAMSYKSDWDENYVRRDPNSGLEDCLDYYAHTIKIDLLKQMPNVYVKDPNLSNEQPVQGSIITASCDQVVENSDDEISTWVGYYLSKDRYLSGDDLLLSDDKSTLQGSYDSDYVSDNITIPSTQIPGRYWILFVSDYKDEITESDEDNVAAIPIDIIASSNKDLALNHLWTIENHIVGESKTIYLNISNTQNTEVGNFSFSIAGTNGGANIRQSYNTSKIGPLETINYSTRINFPESGNWILTGSIDIQDQNLSNNSSNLPIYVAPPKFQNLSLSGLEVRDDLICPNQVTRVYYNLDNIGTAASANSKMEMILSQGQAFHKHTFDLADIDPGGGLTSWREVVFSKPGWWDIKATIIANEHNTGNNVAELKTEVKQSPLQDLSLSGLEIRDDPVYPDKNTRIYYTLDNIGTAASADSKMEILLTNAGIVHKHTFDLADIEPSSGLTGWREVMFPEEGTWIISSSILADEIDLSNNNHEFKFLVEKRPEQDLSLDQIRTHGNNVNALTPTKIYFDLSNIGEATSREAKVTVDLILDNSSSLYSEFNLEPLEANRKVVKEIEIVFPKSGQWSVAAKIIADEENENNHIRTSIISVSDWIQPDFSITSAIINGNEPIYKGETREVALTIQDFESSEVSFVDVDIYLDNRFYNTYTVEIQERIGHVKFNYHFNESVFRLYALVDPDNHFNESNETNNSFSIERVVEQPTQKEIKVSNLNIANDQDCISAEIRFDVVELGGLFTEDIEVLMYVDDKVYSSELIQLDAYEERSFDLTYDNEGQHSFRVEVDLDDSDPTNNSLETDFELISDFDSNLSSTIFPINGHEFDFFLKEGEEFNLIVEFPDDDLIYEDYVFELKSECDQDSYMVTIEGLSITASDHKTVINQSQIGGGGTLDITIKSLSSRNGWGRIYSKTRLQDVTGYANVLHFYQRGTGSQIVSGVFTGTCFPGQKVCEVSDLVIGVIPGVGSLKDILNLSLSGVLTLKYSVVYQDEEEYEGIVDAYSYGATLAGASLIIELSTSAGLLPTGDIVTGVARHFKNADELGLRGKKLWKPFKKFKSLDNSENLPPLGQKLLREYKSVRTSKVDPGFLKQYLEDLKKFNNYLESNLDNLDGQFDKLKGDLFESEQALKIFSTKAFKPAWDFPNNGRNVWVLKPKNDPDDFSRYVLANRNGEQTINGIKYIDATDIDIVAKDESGKYLLVQAKSGSNGVSSPDDIEALAALREKQRIELIKKAIDESLDESVKKLKDNYEIVGLFVPDGLANIHGRTSDEEDHSPLIYSDNLILSSFEGREEILLYPNPATNSIQIPSNLKMKDFRYKIISLGGKVVQQGPITSEIILVNDVPNGLYIFECGDSLYSKILIQRE